MAGEPRVFSAKRTAFYKFVMPLLTLGVTIGIVTVALRASTSSTPLFAKVVVVGLIVAYLLGARRYATFLTPPTFASSEAPHPIVEELRDAVTAAKRALP